MPGMTSVPGARAVVSLSPLGEQLGVEVAGVDAAGPLAETARRAVLGALREHHLLLLRDQRLTPAQQVAVSRGFGPVETYLPEMTHPDHPEVVVLSGAGHTATHYWHTDGLSRREPSNVTLLHPRQLPHEGGDTLFVNACTAYETLPEGLRGRIEGRRMAYGPGEEITHHIVRTHPVTGRKALYLDLMIYQGRVVGMGSREKEGLLRELLAHVERPGAVYRHSWRLGDLLVWDNASVLHRAADAVPAGARVLHRTTVGGTTPS